MKKSKYVLICALTVAVVSASWAAFRVVSAKETAKKTTATNSANAKSDPMQVADDGFLAMRAIHSARLAIFNGDTKLCEDMLTKANEFLDKAEKDESVAKVKSDFIPIDGSLALADTFVASEEKAQHIQKANEHFKSGDRQKGIEQLKLGEIDVNFSRVLMPLEATKKRLAEAMSLAKDHKYYESNLALKAAEEGLVLDSVSLIDFPKDHHKVIAKNKSDKDSKSKSKN